MNSRPWKRTFNHPSLAMSKSPAFSNILQLLYCDCLISFLATYPFVTFALFSFRTLSTNSCVLVLKMSSVMVKHSRFSHVISSSQKLIYSLIMEWHRNILSEFSTSCKLSRNLLPFICLYWEKHCSTGSLCSLVVITY